MKTLQELTLEEVDDLVPLTLLSQELDVPLVTVRRWADPDRNNGFPECVTKVGQVKFYYRSEVEVWHKLWMKTERAKNNRHG